jgi:hypothetical protein
MMNFLCTVFSWAFPSYMLKFDFSLLFWILFGCVLKILCNNIYLLNYVLKLWNLWHMWMTFHLWVMQNRFGILQFIYYCLLVKLYLLN